MLQISSIETDILGQYKFCGLVYPTPIIFYNLFICLYTLTNMYGIYQYTIKEIKIKEL